MSICAFKNNDQLRQYRPLYKYSSPPIMPGIRTLYGVPEEKHRVMGLNKLFYSYPTAKYIRIPNYVTKPQKLVENFGLHISSHNNIVKIVLIAIVLLLIFQLINKKIII